MTIRTLVSAVTVALSASTSAPSIAADVTPLPSLPEKTAGMQSQPGFLDFYWDEAGGRIWLAIDRLDEEMLYIHSLPAGVGSNDIGLDRGQLGATRIVRFRRVGRKLLLEQPNYRYRATSSNPFERRAVEQAFATSTLWGFEVAAQDGGRVLVDATDFLLRDAHGVARRLEERQQGSYHLESSRSAPYLPACRAFPRNTELEASLTFVGKPAGNFIRSVAPHPDAITVRQHHSFVELPNDGFQPRRDDPRSGYGGTVFFDYATAIDKPLRRSWIARHRLEKVDPAAERSPAKEPIVYYVDRGAPEPIRSALIEGASWWAEAFEAIGFEDAFRVELLPEGADPMDLRYNLIQWVHRSTRGWSYGSSVRDPRTGEILKGHVTLGSLRVRQDLMIAEGLLAPYSDANRRPSEPVEMALARLRQLAAHEVGHTLGLSHNFAASARERASVMDYPHPLIELGTDGEIDLSNAYAVGLGAWDRVAIAYGYSDFPPGHDEDGALDEILSTAHRQGLRFITDRDARAAGGAHPKAHLWDNGADPVDELHHILRVRQTALSRFSEHNIPAGTPLSRLEDVLVPIYLLHRYQAQAAAKLLGGLDYSYAIRGDSQRVTAAIEAQTQRRALDALLTTLDPAQLELPPELLGLIPPRPPGYERGRENFRGRTGPTFDPIAAGETAAELTLRLLLHPHRGARLVQQHALDPGQPGLVEVLEELRRAIWGQEPSSGLGAEIRRATAGLHLSHLMRLAAHPEAAGQVQALAAAEVTALDEELAAPVGDRRERAHRESARRRIERFFDNPASVVEPRRLVAPDGDPIGSLDACGDGPWAERL